jgi:hypothetical protein
MVAQQPLTSADIDTGKLLRILRFIAAALFAGQVLFLGVCLVLRASDVMPAIGDGLLFVGIGSLLAVSSTAVSQAVSTMITRAQEGSDDVFTRIRRVSSLAILRLALLEAGGIVNMIFYLLTGHWLLLSFVGLTMAAFVIFRPVPSLFERITGSSAPPPIG